MEKKDLHTHTVYSDGDNTPEEMIISAINAGLTVIGISDHSYTAFDESYCIKKDKILQYKSEIKYLHNKYKDKIEVLCGIEQDYYSEEPPVGYDYVIGSVHYLKLGEEYIPVDEEPKILIDAANRYFGGDIYALIREYYKIVSDVVRKTDAAIIGHLDLIAKRNEITPFFDENDPRYLSARQAAVDALLQTGVPFEVNFGAVINGYRTVPYLPNDVQQYIIKHNGKLLYSSDSHNINALKYNSFNL